MLQVSRSSLALHSSVESTILSAPVLDVTQAWISPPFDARTHAPPAATSVITSATTTKSLFDAFMILLLWLSLALWYKLQKPMIEPDWSVSHTSFPQGRDHRHPEQDQPAILDRSQDQAGCEGCIWCPFTLPCEQGPTRGNQQRVYGLAYAEACPVYQMRERLSRREFCPQRGRHPGPRTTRPGVAPVCSPSLRTRPPLTNTWTMPVAYRCGSEKVARSWIVSGSKTTTSAK